MKIISSSKAIIKSTTFALIRTNILTILSTKLIFESPRTFLSGFPIYPNTIKVLKLSMTPDGMTFTGSMITQAYIILSIIVSKGYIPSTFVIRFIWMWDDISYPIIYPNSPR